MSKNYLNRRNVGHDPIGDPLLGGDPGFSRTRKMYDPVSAVIGAVGSVAAGALAADASKSAAKTQSKAALQAAQLQQQTAQEQIAGMQGIRTQQLDELRNLLNVGTSENRADRQAALNYLQGLQGNLQPYLQTGAQGVTTLGAMIPQLTRSFTAADLKSNLAPNYEFMKQQGLGALAQSMNVGGGGSNMSRAATKFAEDYASNAYQNAFNNWQQQQNNIYNRLQGISGIGTTATGQGAALGTVASQTGLGYDQLLGQQRLGFGGQMAQFNQGMGANIANLATGGAGAAAAGMTGSAAAQAAGQIGATNALTGGLGNATNMYLLSGLINPQNQGISNAALQYATGGSPGDSLNLMNTGIFTPSSGGA